MKKIEGRKPVIGLCFSGIDSEYQTKIFNSISYAAVVSGFTVAAFQAFTTYYSDDLSDHGEGNIFNLVNCDLLDCLVIVSLSIKHAGVIEKLVKRCKEAEIPVISIDVDIEGCYTVAMGYNNAMENIMSHFLDHHGFTKINFISGMKGNPQSEERLEIYKKALEAHGIKYEPERVDYGFFWGTPAAEAVQRFYDSGMEMPEAFVCANDSMAIGVCAKLNSLGFNVPGDIAVSGLDGIKEASVHTPTITTGRLNTDKVGEEVVRIFKELFDGGEPPKRTEIEPQMDYAQSCGCREISGSYDNDLKHRLYVEIDSLNEYSNTMSRMVEDLTGFGSMKKTAERIKPYIDQIWSKKIWICLCENYSDKVLFGGDEELRNAYIKEGYTEKITPFLYVENKEIKPLRDFTSAELIPDFHKEIEELGTLIFIPLHFQDRSIGYMVIDYTANKQNSNYYNFYNLNSWRKNLSLVLENVRIQGELRASVHKLEEMYVHDSMTNTFNRRGFYRVVPSIIKECVSESKKLLVASADMDELKYINDVFGHNEGDVAIITVSNALKEACGEKYIVARFGGDEFVAAGIVADDSEGEDFVRAVTNYLNDFNSTSGKKYKVSASIGTHIVVPEKGSSLDDYIKIADRIMYKVKNNKVREHARR